MKIIILNHASEITTGEPGGGKEWGHYREAWKR